jgi:hypothetical protein
MPLRGACYPMRLGSLGNLPMERFPFHKHPHRTPQRPFQLAILRS